MATQVLTSPPTHSFERDCKEIHEDSCGRLNQLIRALASRTQLERARIRETYNAMYGEDLVSLIARMRSEAARVSPKVCAGLSLLVLDSYDRDAMVAREAFGSQGDTNYKALVEIFVSRKSSHVVLIKQAYQARYKRQLDRDIVDIEPLHPYQKILVALATSHKAHHADVNQHVAKCDARRLYETGEGSAGGIDEAVVLEILTKRSIPQLKLTFSSYKHIYGHDYTKTLTKLGNSAEFEDALKIVIKCMYAPTRYYAKILYTSIKGMRRDDGALARVMVRRAEVDMDEIQRLFRKKYGVELREAICDDIPCGDYRDFLVALASKTSSTN